jgi:prepilin-type N-terminal cleavage/methylation domain-containing protein
MVRKSTISKVLIPHLTKGFTLVELLVGLVIMSIVGGLALNSLVEAGKGYSNDKRNIESSQNLSAVLEMVGNDIKQAGEQINDGKFPSVTIDYINTGTTALKAGSSRITIRRALAQSLTLCENIASATSGKTSLIVADSSLTTNNNCNISATSTSINSNVVLSGATTATALSPTLTRQSSLMTARTTRCQLDDPNINYTSFSNTDFCQSTKPTAPAIDREKVRAAMADSAGNIWTFDYLDDSVTTIGTTTTHRMSIGEVNRTTQAVSAATATPAKYDINNAIYLIEERIYTLDPDGNLKLQKDGEATQVLISGIERFNVSAKIYLDPAAKTINTAPANACTSTQDSDANATQYACTFNAGDNWKTLAGIKVKLQAKYDPSGGKTYTTAELTDSAATAPEILKLRAAAEYFPRNVLSK